MLCGGCSHHHFIASDPKGFRKVDHDRYEFANDGFLSKDRKHLLKTIVRRKPSHNVAQHPPSQAKNTSVNACTEVRKFGLEEEIERLKRDKTVLMQELVKLRLHQQSTDRELQSLRQRLQGMEQNQQQMMSFLAMAVQSPAFLAQLAHKSGNNNRWKTKANKKRRYQPPVTETFNSSMPPSVPNSHISEQLPNMENSANNLSQCGDFALPDYFEQLLASPPLDNGVGPDPESLGIPDLSIDDFDFSEQDIQIEVPRDMVRDEINGGSQLRPEMDHVHGNCSCL
uniref:Uncharacterized protein n=1 Tax=Ananas comosus var. bracteatus TaxID=296719 RepID=A0A6V7PQ42_ANACO|nr:unnamed protein product [Ananas comosus var. bracteatus]